MDKLSSISIFGFFSNWSPFFLVALVFITVVFFLLTTSWRHEIKGNRPLKRSEAILFIICIIMIYIVKGSPIDLLSHILFSFHMLQMAILYLMIIPLLYYAVPSYLIDFLFDQPYVGGFLKFMTKPVVSLIFFNGIFSVYHLPVVLDYLKQSATLHSLFTLLLSFAAACMWYAVFNRSEKYPVQLSGLQKLLFIFLIGVLLTPSCGLIIFAQQPMYKTYTDPKAWIGAMSLCVPEGTLDSVMASTNISGPQYFSNMTPLDDQQTGGVIMKVLQEIFFAIMMLIIFYNWRLSEGKDEEATTQRSLEERRKQEAYFNQYR